MPLKFGTSGLRGLMSELNGLPSYTYAYAFSRFVQKNWQSNLIFVGRDLRQSSPQIAQLCLRAMRDCGLKPVNLGALPTPALALAAIQAHAPAIMVTGSHIPDDRNGLKFYLPTGEITKEDEVLISEQVAQLLGCWDQDALNSLMTERPQRILYSQRDGIAAYQKRYVEFFAPHNLQGLRVAVYQHSSMARDLLVETLHQLGATVIPLGRSDKFIPVDTEALSHEDQQQAKIWAQDIGFDALVSTDGDADRPLLADEAGNFLRGDLVGALTAHALGADTIVTPITSNSALEKNHLFPHLIRTAVGSPYVIEAMKIAASTRNTIVIGFEANGGVLLGSPLMGQGVKLERLPTRDAILPILTLLTTMAAQQQPLSAIAARFNFTKALSGKIENIPFDQQANFLKKLRQPNFQLYFESWGGLQQFNDMDGIRLSLGLGILHFRASGNAPELRIYVEALDIETANSLMQFGLKLVCNHID